MSCWRGLDANGAHLLIVRPAAWHGGLVVHIHGGPRMATPGPNTSDEDVVRYAEFLAEGFAVAATSRRRAGFGVTRAAEDAESARQGALAALGPVRLTVLHGQSWGGAVAAKAIEAMNRPGPDGRRPYDAALLTSAVLAGPTRAYDMRVDLLAAFAALCGAAPERPTREQLVARLNDCTGADLAEAARSPAQRRALADLAAASRIPEAALAGHLWWATQVFADIRQNLTRGASPFGNQSVRYRGTGDDEAFNAAIPRQAPDPAARAALAADGDLTGRIAIPVLSLHGVGDPTVFVENQAAYRQTLERAGTAALLAQIYVDEAEHQKMSPVLYATALAALDEWVRRGERPTPASFRLRCETMQAGYPGECRILEPYQPQPWEARVNPRSPVDSLAGR